MIDPNNKVFPTYTHHGREYSLPYWLPEGKNGKSEVSIEFKDAGSRLPLVSMRNSLFMGLQQCNLILDRPLGIHHLKEIGQGTWMSSMPQEIEQHHRQLAGMKGRVLVGGLGLGLAVAILEGVEAITEIVVVEKNSELLQLVGKFIPKDKTKLLHFDLYEYLKRDRETFDFAFYDIWQSTGEHVLTEHVMPLRRLSQHAVRQDCIQCWNEGEMIGQVHMGCRTAVMYYFCDAPADNPFKTMFSISDEEFERRRSVGLVWYFYRWLRRSNPSQNYALAAADEFAAALRDPMRFDKEWVNNEY